jgi:hypothetical protein
MTGMQTFFAVMTAVLCALWIRDGARSSARKSYERLKEDEEQAKDHNLRMNVAHDRGDAEQAQMYAEIYGRYKKSVRRRKWFSQFLWPI